MYLNRFITYTLFLCAIIGAYHLIVWISKLVFYALHFILQNPLQAIVLIVCAIVVTLIYKTH